MQLEFPHDPQLNLLPIDGVVHYYGVVFQPEDAQRMYEELLRVIQWENDKAIIFGKTIVTKRKVAWYADQPFEYTYSKVTKTALPWVPILQEILQQVETITGETYNSCLLNLYHDQSEGMAWHSDGETDLKKHGAIASVSFGAERRFAFKHKSTAEKVNILLQHGSLLVMKGKTQDHWLHRLPPVSAIHGPRINLTFRTVMK